MFKSILSVLALSTLAIAPVSAELRRLGTDSYVAYDAKDRAHYIDYVRMDHEGDVLVEVNVERDTVYFWINCRDDRISAAGDAFNGWDYVDHRKMEGYYSDVACRN